MKTEKLYENDSYIKEFEAEVVAVTDKGAVLDRTAFFPEGGGQYGDTGYIGDVRVTDTVIDDGVIYHVTEAPVETGRVNCRIDWEKRFVRMQNHTGEHILSGVISNSYGYHNVGFHLSDEEVTLDLDGKLTDGDVEFLEREVNRLIYENHPVIIFYPEPEELKNIDYRSKLDLTENVRIVRVEGVDRCACCAPHLSSTAQVGILKIVKHYNYKGGTRLHILCGELAERDYHRLSEINTELTNRRSAKRYELIEVYERMEKEIADLKEAYNTLMASVITAKVDSAEDTAGNICYFAENFSMPDLIRLADASVARYPDRLTAAFCGNDTEGYNFVIGGYEAKEFFAGFKSRFNARGGGRDMYQGKVTATKSELNEYMK